MIAQKKHRAVGGCQLGKDAALLVIVVLPKCGLVFTLILLTSKSVIMFITKCPIAP